MKTNFLKAVIPAFAFMLAIVASLAFTSVETETPKQGWIQTNNNPSLCTIDRSDCVIENTGAVCTVDGTPFTQQVFAKNPTLCNQILYLPTE